jgi:hypothetical protein
VRAKHSCQWWNYNYLGVWKTSCCQVRSHRSYCPYVWTLAGRLLEWCSLSCNLAIPVIEILWECIWHDKFSSWFSGHGNSSQHVCLQVKSVNAKVIFAFFGCDLEILWGSYSTIILSTTIKDSPQKHQFSTSWRGRDMFVFSGKSLFITVKRWPGWLSELIFSCLGL